MILWLDGGHGPRENMRRDAALLESVVSQRRLEPVLRLFAFAPRGITLGRSQDPARELDLAALSAAGIEWAVRPTGGRAILHDEEWTFSLATGLRADHWAADANRAYARTCALLARAMTALGVPVELSSGSARGPGSPRAASGAASPCFASTARHELTIAGRKFAGIAQRQIGSGLLQQGSLLLGDSHLELSQWLALAPAVRAGSRAELANACATAAPWLGIRPPLARLGQVLAELLPEARRVAGEDGALELGVRPNA